jgi:hypothetical protein
MRFYLQPIRMQHGVEIIRSSINDKIIQVRIFMPKKGKK